MGSVNEWLLTLTVGSMEIGYIPNWVALKGHVFLMAGPDSRATGIVYRCFYAVKSATHFMVGGMCMRR